MILTWSMRLMLVVLLSALAYDTYSQEQPASILEGKVLVKVMQCEDKQTHKQGECAVFIGEDRVPFIGFRTFDGVIQFIRKLNEDGTYDEVYTHGLRPA